MTPSPASVIVGPSQRTRLPTAVWLASCVTFLATSADNIVLLLLLWLAGPQGWTGTQTAILVLVLRMPALVTGSVVGRAVDSWGPRRMIIADLAIRAVLLVLLTGFGLVSGRLPLSAVLVAGGASGALSPATYAAVRCIIPRLVPTTKFGRANAAIGLSDQLPLLVGGALVAPSLVVLGPVLSLAVPAALLLMALALARRLPKAASHVMATEMTAVTGRSMPERSERRFPTRVLALITLSSAYYFFYGPFETATAPFVRERLHANQATYGLLWMLFGLGATLALPIGAMLAGRHRPGLVNALGTATWGLLMLPLVVLDSITFVAALFLISGFVWGPYTTIEIDALQRWTDPSRHGALFGLQRGLLRTAAPIGAAAGAIAIQHLAAHIVLAVSAAACATVGVLALLNRDLRQAH